MFNIVGNCVTGTLRYLLETLKNLGNQVPVILKNLVDSSKEVKELKARVKHLEEAYDYALKANVELSTKYAKSVRKTTNAINWNKMFTKSTVARVTPQDALASFGIDDKLLTETKTETISLEELIKKWQKGD